MASKSSRKISRSSRTNPLKTAGITKRYTKQLVAGFRSFRILAVDTLKQSRGLSVRELAMAPYNLEYIAEEMIRLTNSEILAPASGIIESNIPEAYNQGVIFGETQLAKIGVRIAVGAGGPVDMNVVNLLKTKNLIGLKGITEEMNKQINQQLAEGILNGESFPDLAKRITGRVDSIGITRAQTLARTEVQVAANRAAETRYAQAGIEYAEWLTANDDRVSDQDLNKNGIIFRLADGITAGYLRGQGYTPLDGAALPPSHPNCFLPGTRYKPAGNIVSGIWGNYAGKVIVIKTENGNRISVTPNHLFLTPHGFCAADFLNIGDDVICCSGFERELDSVNPDNDRVIPVVEEIIKSLAMSDKVLPGRVPAAPEHLHNDGGSIDGDINIVSMNRLLWSNEKTPVIEHLGEDLFRSANTDPFNLSRLSSLDSFIEGMLSTFGRLMSSRRETSAFFWGRIRHTDEHRLTAVPLNESDRFKPACNGFSADLGLFREFLNGYPGLMSLDKIKDIKIDSFHGVVYDFETTSSLSLAEGFVTSNCRCAVVPVTAAEVRARGLIE